MWRAALADTYSGRGATRLQVCCNRRPLPPIQQPEIQSLGPQVLCPPRVDWTDCACRRGGREVRDPVHVQHPVDLLARPGDVGPVQDAVPGEYTQAMSQVVPDVHPDLGDDRKLLVAIAA